MVEVYPKLDAHLLYDSEGQPFSELPVIGTVMQNLLWMLEVAQHRVLVETEQGHLAEKPISYFDLFAYLLGKNLLLELEQGVPHAYVSRHGELSTLRGRIDFTKQATRNWNRFDRIACVWDDFTPNTALNQLFRCACEFLSDRVTYPVAWRILRDCQSLLDEVEGVSPQLALLGAETVRFDRSFDRFAVQFELARRLLRGIGHDLAAGDAKTFVFLLDMNEVFERYAHAVLEAHFDTHVAEQVKVGTLFQLPTGGISQIADYCWSHSAKRWIGDAKYKNLIKGGSRALRFADLEDDDGTDETSDLLAGRVLSASDIRQLTVYAELCRKNGKLPQAPNLALLYPFIGSANECIPASVTTWNGSTLWLVPVQVKRQASIGAAIRILPVTITS